VGTSSLGGVAAFGGDDPGGREGEEGRVRGSGGGGVVLRGDVEGEIQEGEGMGGQEG
jgi:hypothetical protein